MGEDRIRYDVLAQDALRGVIRSVLARVAKSGLPGDHHFYIAFDTRADGVSISKRLRDQYPEEMTIVLQYQFWDLEVSEERFEVKLSFNNIPERLVVPFAAVRAFFDPSVQFGLQFGAERPANDSDRAGGGVPAIVKAEEAVRSAGQGGGVPAADAPGHGEPAKTPAAEVVELDLFRKK